MRRATELVNGLRVAICEAREGLRKESADSETVFTVKLNVSKGED